MAKPYRILSLDSGGKAIGEVILATTELRPRPRVALHTCLEVLPPAEVTKDSEGLSVPHPLLL